MLQCTDNFFNLLIVSTLHCLALTNSDVKIKFSSFYLEIFSCHTLWLSLCSLVLRYLIVQ